MKTILEPFAEATFKLEYRGVNGNTGSLWQWLDKLDHLLTFLETQKSMLQANPYHNKHVLAMVERIWQKLDYYYRLSDDSPAYRAAIVLHPGKKLHWFYKHWNTRPEWLEQVEYSFRELVYSYVEDPPATPPPAPQRIRSSPRKRKPRTDYRPDDSDSDWETGDSVENELSLYLKSPPVNRLVDKAGKKTAINVIEWWLSYRTKLPILSRIALDLIAAPLEESDLERQFSDALNAFTDKRYGLKPTTTEDLMLLKAGFKAGLVLWPEAAAASTPQQGNSTASTSQRSELMSD